MLSLSLWSDVICGKCGQSSTALDPIFDISLDLRRHAAEGVLVFGVVCVARVGSSKQLVSCLMQSSKSQLLLASVPPLLAMVGFHWPGQALGPVRLQRSVLDPLAPLPDSVWRPPLCSRSPHSRRSRIA